MTDVDQKDYFAEPQKPTHNAPAETLRPIRGKPPAPDVPVGEDDPLPSPFPDGGEDVLSGLPRNMTSERVGEGTEEAEPDVPMADVPRNE